MCMASQMRPVSLYIGAGGQGRCQHAATARNLKSAWLFVTNTNSSLTARAQQLVVSHAELPTVACAGRLVPVGVRAADKRGRQALIDPELHAPWVALR